MHILNKTRGQPVSVDPLSRGMREVLKIRHRTKLSTYVVLHEASDLD